MKWTVPSSLGMTYNDKARGLGLVWQALRYALTHQGLLGLPASPIRAYVRTRAGLDAPDAAISWMPFLSGANFKLAKAPVSRRSPTFCVRRVLVAFICRPKHRTGNRRSVSTFSAPSSIAM